MRSNRAVLLVLALLVCGANVMPGVVRAQQPDQDKPDDASVVQLSVELVQIDAVVTDSKGQQVTDLKPEDFEVLENGKRQQITNFSYVNLQPTEEARVAPPTTAPALGHEAMREEQVHRTMAFVVDDFNVSFENLYYVRRALTEFVDTQMQPGDLVAILRTSGGVAALQQFTTDRFALHAAIDRLQISTRRPLDPVQQLSVVGPGGPGAAPEVEKKDMADPMGTLSTRESLSGLQHLVRGLGPLPGRKSIVLFSDSLRIMDVALGEEAHSTHANNDVQDAVRRLVDQANRAAVVINTIQSTGLTTGAIMASSGVTGTPKQLTDRVRQGIVDRQTAQGGLESLAHGTGGRFLHDTNDLGDAVRRIVADQKGYYLIGWTPEPDAFKPEKGTPRFNSVDVRVTRPGMTVRTRTGYYGVERNDAPKNQPPVVQLLTSMESPFSSSAVRVNLTPLFFDESGSSFVRAMLDIDARDLSFVAQKDGTRMANFELVAAAYDLDGAIQKWDAQRYTVHIREEVFDRTVNDGLLYTLTVPIKSPGAYQIRAAVRDVGSGNLGSAYQFVEVPNVKRGQLAMSSLLVSGAEAGRPAPSGIPDPSASGANGSQPEGVVHPAIRKFKRGMRLVTSFFVYNPGIDKATHKPELRTQLRLYAEGKPVFSGAPQPVRLDATADAKHVTVQRVLRLGTDLKPGRYLVQVVVTDLHPRKQRAASVEQWADLVLE